jgi:hypothetical protein
MGTPLRFLWPAVAFPIVLALCSQSPANQPAGAPFSIAIRLTKDVVKAGAEVRLDIVLTDVAEEKIVIAECGEPNYQIEIYNSEGKPLPRLNDCVPKKDPNHPVWTTLCPGDVTTASTRLLCLPQSQTLKVLKPQETMKEEMLLNTLYDLSRPGSYSIQVHLSNDPKTVVAVPGKFGYSRDIELNDKMNDISRATVNSNAVKLTVELALQP